MRKAKVTILLDNRSMQQQQLQSTNEKMLVETFKDKDFISYIVLHKEGLNLIASLFYDKRLSSEEHKKIVLNCRDAYGNTLLHYAIASCHYGLISIIFKHHSLFDFNAKNNRGYVALHNLANICDLKVCRSIILFVNHYGSYDFSIKNPTTQFSILGKLLLGLRDFETAELVISLDKGKEGAFLINETNSKHQTILHIAACYNMLNVIDFLFRQDKLLVNKLDSAGYSPLLCAIAFGNDKVVYRMLFDHRTKFLTTLEFTKHNILHLMACNKKAFPVLQRLILIYNNKHENSHIGERVVHIIKSLINQSNEEGYTPLVLAVIKKNYDALKVFMHCDAINNYQVYSQAGVNVLHYVVRKCDYDALNILMQNKELQEKCINQGDCMLRTPLHCAAIAQNIFIISFLISKGANIFLKDGGNKHFFDLLEDNVKDAIREKFVGIESKLAGMQNRVRDDGAHGRT